MVEPLIFVTTITLKEGKLEDFKHYSQQMGKFVEENEPRIIHFEQYINEEGTELTSVQIHPDEDSIAFHMQVAGVPMAQASEFIDTIKSLHNHQEPPYLRRAHRRLRGTDEIGGQHSDRQVQVLWVQPPLGSGNA